MEKQRLTKQRQIIESILRNTRRPLLPKELLSSAQQTMPQLGIATIFRNLKKLVEEGKVNIVDLPGDSPRYERSDIGHHHHFKCRECQKVYEVFGCPGNLEQMIPDGFQLTDHDITLFGLCASCSNQ